MLLVAGALCLCGCREAPRQGIPPGLWPPVILISLDTLRSDALAHGEPGAGSTTPHVDRLVADSIHFSSGVTEIPFTLPAHMSMLTGAAPDVHGVFGEDDRLPRGLATLAELLAEAGYATAGVVSSDWLGPGFGFARGFERYERIEHGLEFAERVNRAALDSLDWIHGGGRPPFLFVHYYDAHSDSAQGGNRRPYWAPEELSTDLDPECREGLCTPGGECATGYLLWASHHPDEVDARALRCLQESYRAGVRALDEGVGALLAGLEARGLYEPALILLTSDHGEEFGEHGQFIHAQTHHESVAIPLAIKLPGGREGGGRDPRAAQLADLLPTILGVLELEMPPGMTGSDLLAPSDRAPSIAVAQNKHRPERYALMEGRWKLIHDFITDRTRLYDRELDPEEVVDLARERPDVVAGLMSRLEARLREYREIRASVPSGPEVDNEALDVDARRRLEALGYVD
jgi:arylsulfatase A-like enzyme